MKSVLSLLLLLNSLFLFSQDFSSSNLPVVEINTDDGWVIRDEEKIWADMTIINREDGERNRVGETHPELLDFDGRIKIEVRGSSTQGLEKKQYGFTTYDPEEEKDNVKLLGMPKENDWILNGLAFDSSMVRDFLSYELSRNIGQYASRTVYCELVLNGDYRGLYLLQEKLKADDNRIDINKINDDARELPELSGGYITKSDKVNDDDPSAWTMPTLNGGHVDFVHEVPKPDDLVNSQHQYIKGVFEELALQARNHNESLENGYPSIIDVASFVDFMLLNELASNVDGYQFSTFFHKDRNGKLRAGPIWDFNLSFGNDLDWMWGIFWDRSHHDVWQFDNGDNTGADFWKNLFDSPGFACRMQARWLELTDDGAPFNPGVIDNKLDSVSDWISEAVERENERWGTSRDFPGEIDFIKQFVKQRVGWMDVQLASTDQCIDPEIPSLKITGINYHPADPGTIGSKEQEFIELTNAGVETIDLSGIYFGGTGLVYQFIPGSTLTAGESIRLAGDKNVYFQKYGSRPFDEYTRGLSNGGQRIELRDGMGYLIDQVTYSDEAPWPDADGNGFYLSLISPELDNDDPANWQAVQDVELVLSANNKELIWMIYPNPVGDELNIEIKGDETLDLISISGEKIKSWSLESGYHKLDVSDVPSGLYLVRSSKSHMNTKIIKN